MEKRRKLKEEIFVLMMVLCMAATYMPSFSFATDTVASKDKDQTAIEQVQDSQPQAEQPDGAEVSAGTEADTGAADQEAVMTEGAEEAADGPSEDIPSEDTETERSRSSWILRDQGRSSLLSSLYISLRKTRTETKRKSS